MNKGLKLKGIWEISRVDRKTGKVIDKEVLKNVITGDGKERVSKLINGVSTTYFDYIAIGTGTTAAQSTDTALETEDVRQQATTSYEASYKAVFEKTFDFIAEKAITELALSDSATESGSTILNRLVFSAKNVDSDTSLFISVTISIS